MGRGGGRQEFDEVVRSQPDGLLPDSVLVEMKKAEAEAVKEAIDVALRSIYDDYEPKEEWLQRLLAEYRRRYDEKTESGLVELNRADSDSLDELATHLYDRGYSVLGDRIDLVACRSFDALVGRTDEDE